MDKNNSGEEMVMAQYSTEDKLAFKKKDLLYARQTAANVTSAIFEGKEVDSDTFIEYADKVFDWLFQEQEKLDVSNVPNTSTNSVPKPVSGFEPPKPTVEQKKVLDAIFSKVGYDGMIWEDMCQKVLNYSTEVAGVSNPTYPKSMASVDKIVEWINV
jgi:hypothetical protein